MGYDLINAPKFQKAMRKKQEKINEISRKMKKAPKSVNIGWDSSSGKYTEQATENKPAPTVQEVALIHEWGTSTIPESAMLRTTKARVEPMIQELVKRKMKAAKRVRKLDFYKLAEDIGELVKRELHDTVFTLDLVDTTRLANSIVIKYRRR